MLFKEIDHQLLSYQDVFKDARKSILSSDVYSTFSFYSEFRGFFFTYDNAIDLHFKF